MRLKIMKAKIGHESDLDREDAIFEPKLDGYRVLLTVEENKIRLTSRGGLDYTNKYPNLNAKTLLPHIKAKNCILDGEVIALDQKGNPNFSKLQGGNASTFAVFDILEKNGKMLIDLTQMERKKILEKTVKDGKHIEKVPYTTNGRKLWKEMEKRGLEGVMVKDPEGFYHPGKRHATWLKVKFNQTIDCVIIGYTSNKREISSLALRLYTEEGKLRYIGKVGTGFYGLIGKLYDKLTKIETKDVPLNQPRT